MYIYADLTEFNLLGTFEILCMCITVHVIKIPYLPTLVFAVFVLVLLFTSEHRDCLYSHVECEFYNHKGISSLYNDKIGHRFIFSSVLCGRAAVMTQSSIVR